MNVNVIGNVDFNFNNNVNVNAITNFNAKANICPSTVNLFLLILL